MCDCCTNSFQLKCCGNLGDPCETCKTCYNALEGLVNHLLKVAGGVGLFFSFTLVSFLCTNVHSLWFWGTGTYSKFQVMGMVIGGQKTKPQKIPCRTYAATHTGTTMNLQIVLNTQKNPCRLKSSHSRKYLQKIPTPTKKNTGIKNSNPKNSSIIPVTWNPEHPHWVLGSLNVHPQ